MISEAAQRLLAIFECAAPMMDDSQIERVAGYVMRVAGEGSTRAETERRRRVAEKAWEEQELARTCGPAELARRSREPA